MKMTTLVLLALWNMCARKNLQRKKTKRKQLIQFNFSWWVCVQRRSCAHTQTSGNYVHRSWRVFTALKYLFQKMNFWPIFQRKNIKRNFVRGIDEKICVRVSLCLFHCGIAIEFFYCKLCWMLNSFIDGWHSPLQINAIA